MRAPRPRSSPESTERGAVLVLVLLILAAVTAVALSLAREARVEVAVARARADEVRLRSLIDSAVQRALAELRNDEEPGDDLFAPWRDDEARFRGVEHDGGRYWLVFGEPDPGDGRELRYGIRDEGSKLDVNVATREQLLALPGVTEDAVDGILDWRDADEDASEFGAESSYYGALDPPYQAKNAPIERLDELLRVWGIDEAMLWGEDRNRNGLLDPGEDDGDRSFPPDDADGVLDRGLADYLTVFSRELNRTADGRSRLDVTQAQPDEVEARLETAGVAADVIQRVLQVISGGGPGGGPGGGGAQQGGGQQGGGQQGGVSSLGELILRAQVEDPEQAALLLDELTTLEQDVIPGRVNVNTCPRELLLGLELEEEEVDAILTKRLDASVDKSTPAWLLDALTLPVFAVVVDRVTTRSSTFTVHAVALLDDRPSFRRVEVLVDRSFVPVRVLAWRDLTPLGFPLPEERGAEDP